MIGSRPVPVILMSVLVAGIHPAGCKKPDEVFTCRDDRQCVLNQTQGLCQSSGLCSFPDPGCPSGQRFGQHVPLDLRNQCVVASACGDGVLGPGEMCDDGNLVNDDGCTKSCVSCGDNLGDDRVAGPDGSCFVRINEPLRWHKAQAACVDLGGHLATFASETEQAGIETALLKGDRARFWIGHHVVLRRNAIEWVTGEPVLNNHWHPGSQPGPTSEGDCTSMSPGTTPEQSTIRYLWSLEDCSNARPFICEVPPWRHRPNGRGAYRMLYQELSWQDARDACRDLGAQLVVISDEAERVFITDRFFGPFWIGATDKGHEGDFVWVDGSPMTYHDFAANEPDNHQGKQHCVLVDRDGHWHDRSCYHRHHPLCEWP